MAGKDGPSTRSRPFDQGYATVWALIDVAITGNEVTIDGSENMAEVLRIRTIRGWNKPQPELLAGFLHKVCELMYLKKRHERVQKTPLVSVHQANEGCPSRSHHRRLALWCFAIPAYPRIRSR